MGSPCFSRGHANLCSYVVTAKGGTGATAFVSKLFLGYDMLWHAMAPHSPKSMLPSLKFKANKYDPLSWMKTHKLFSDFSRLDPLWLCFKMNGTKLSPISNCSGQGSQVAMAFWDLLLELHQRSRFCRCFSRCRL